MGTTTVAKLLHGVPGIQVVHENKNEFMENGVLRHRELVPSAELVIGFNQANKTQSVPMATNTP